MGVINDMIFDALASKPSRNYSNTDYVTRQGFRRTGNWAFDPKSGWKFSPRTGVKPQPFGKAGGSNATFTYGPVLKALGHLARQVVTKHPALRLAHIAFELAYEMDNDAPWAWKPEQPASYDMTGWSQCCDSGTLKPEKVRFLQGVNGQPCVYAPQCTTILQVPSGDYGVATHTFTNTTSQPMSAWTVFGRAQIGGLRMDFEQVHWRQIPGNSSIESPNPIPYMPPQLRPVPALAPPQPAITERFKPDLKPEPELRVPPYKLPTVDFDLGSKPETAPKGRLGWHNKLPPKTGEKEKKLPTGLPTAAKLIAALYDAGTEASEITDILYDALGKKCPGARSMSDKAYCVYKNLNSLDIDTAIKDIIWNHYEDKVWGRFFGLGKKAPYGSMGPGQGPTRNPTLNLSQRT